MTRSFLAVACVAATAGLATAQSAAVTGGVAPGGLFAQVTVQGHPQLFGVTRATDTFAAGTGVGYGPSGVSTASTYSYRTPDGQLVTATIAIGTGSAGSAVAAGDLVGPGGTLGSSAGLPNGLPFASSGGTAPAGYPATIRNWAVTYPTYPMPPLLR